MTEAESRSRAARLRLIGGFRLSTADGVTIEVPNRRARALLAYLALAPENRATRERLRGLFWTDRGEPQARASLRDCLRELRGVLAAAALDMLEVERETVSLTPGAVICDVEVLEAALDDAAETQAALGEVGARRLLDNLELGGLFDEWRGQARERLDRRITAAVHDRLRDFEARAEWTSARALAEAYFQRDRLDEAVVAAAIRADLALGATGAAHRRFQTLKVALAKDLGVAPGPVVREALTAAVVPPSAQTSGGRSARDGRSPLALPDKPSIAVLPFKNLGGDPEQEYFVDAVTDDIVDALSRSRWFFVIARDSSFAFRDANLRTGRVGAELGVRYILKGSVRRNGDSLRVTAQIIDAANGSHIWAEKYARKVGDIFDLQDEITEQVVAAIEPAILRGEGLRASRKTTNDFNALDCFYRGMWHFNKMSDEDDVKAQALFEEAITRDPELALGHIGLARVLYGRAILGLSERPEKDLHRSLAAARTAIGLDGTDAHGYFAAAGASLYLHDHDAALEDARRAVSLNRNFSYGDYRLGQVLIFSGEPAEAIAPIARSLRLSPFDPQTMLILETLALACYQARDYEQAVEQAKSAVNMGRLSANGILAAALAMLDRTAEAAIAHAASRALPRSSRRAMAQPYKDPQWQEHLRAGFRKAAPREKPSLVWFLETV